MYQPSNRLASQPAPASHFRKSPQLDEKKEYPSLVAAVKTTSLSWWTDERQTGEGGQTGRWATEWTVGWMDAPLDGWSEWTVRWMDGWIDVSMERWVNVDAWPWWTNAW